MNKKPNKNLASLKLSCSNALAHNIVSKFPTASILHARGNKYQLFLDMTEMDVLKMFALFHAWQKQQINRKTIESVLEKLDMEREVLIRDLLIERELGEPKNTIVVSGIGKNDTIAKFNSVSDLRLFLDDYFKNQK